MDERSTTGTRLLQKLVDVRPGEVHALLLSCLYYFLVLTSYYIIRPIRDQMGVAGGVDNLQWLFTGTLIGMLLFNPPFAALVRNFPRRVFIPITYGFFMLNLLLFFLLFRTMPESWNVWIGRTFFIWTSVFNLFVVSVMWSFMADIFRSEQGKRLFALIAVGGTAGAILGSSIVSVLVGITGPINLLLVSTLFLGAALACAQALGRTSGDPTSEPEAGRPATVRRAAAERPIGGGVLSGISHVFRSPYLLGICIFMLLFTIGSTFLYFQQAAIIDAAVQDDTAQTALFARIDLAVNILTLGGQLFITGRLLKWFGVAAVLAILPAISVLGFLGLGFMPVLGMVIAFQILRRAGNFAVARPTREVLFTVVSREDKYKAKNFIDTVVYRGGDQIGAWSYALMGWLGLGVAGIAFVAAPLSAVWLVVALWLGREQARRAASQQDDGVVAAREPALA